MPPLPRYRTRLKRHIPWVVVGVLGLIYLLVFGRNYMMWTQESRDHQMLQGEKNEVQKLTLLNVDRQLRASDALTGRPPWARWLFFTSNANSIHEDVLKSMDAAEPAFDPHGKAVHAILLASEGKLERAREVAPAAATGMEARLLHSWLGHKKPTRGQMLWLQWRLSGTLEGWWDVELAKGINTVLGGDPQLEKAIALNRAQNKDTLTRALAPQLVNWVFALCGVVFIPVAFRSLRSAFHTKAEGYLSRISINQGLSVFMIGDLAAMGLITCSYVLLGIVADEWPLGVDILLDTIWRLLPAVIAMAWFFVRYRHVHRAYHFEASLPWAMLLGLFSLLTIVEVALHPLLEPLLPVDPTGGLDAMEQGWDGLAYGLISACVMAPIGEEFLYRGVLFRSLGNRMGTFRAAVISSVVFALAHNYDAYGFISVGLFGFCMALLYQSTRSLAVPILFHAFYNFTITVPAWILYFAP